MRCLTNLYCGYSIMKSKYSNTLCYPRPLERHNTTNIGIELGFHCQMTHVESLNDESIPPITLTRKQGINEPQPQFQQFQILLVMFRNC